MLFQKFRTITQIPEANVERCNASDLKKPKLFPVSQFLAGTFKLSFKKIKKTVRFIMQSININLHSPDVSIHLHP